MRNLFDDSLLRAAVFADHAQDLRGGCVFGAVAYRRAGGQAPVEVRIEQGYADCLPVLGGGFWRDPALAHEAEADR